MSDETLLGKAIREALLILGRSNSVIDSVCTCQRGCLDTAVTRIEFAVNNALGLAANEAEKAARRKEAVEALGNHALSRYMVDTIIKKAQG